MALLTSAAGGPSMSSAAALLGPSGVPASAALTPSTPIMTLRGGCNPPWQQQQYGNDTTGTGTTTAGGLSSGRYSRSQSSYDPQRSRGGGASAVVPPSSRAEAEVEDRCCRRTFSAGGCAASPMILSSLPTITATTTTPPAGPEPLLLSRSEVYEVLRAVLDGLDRLGIPHVLIGSTLLGSVRSKSLLFHDDKVEVAILDDEEVSSAGEVNDVGGGAAGRVGRYERLVRDLPILLGRTARERSDAASGGMEYEYRLLVLILCPLLNGLFERRPDGLAGVCRLHRRLLPQPKVPRTKARQWRLVAILAKIRLDRNEFHSFPRRDGVRAPRHENELEA